MPNWAIVLVTVLPFVILVFSSLIVPYFEDIIDFIGDIFELIFEYWYISLTIFIEIVGITFLILGSLGFQNIVSLNKTTNWCFLVFGIIFIIIPIIVWVYLFFSGYISKSNNDYYMDIQEKTKKDNIEEKSNTSKTKTKLNLTKEKMSEFDSFFSHKIIGQEHAVQLVKQQFINFLYEIDDKRTRPAGIFFFVGPTGVGKTEMCKLINDFLYNNNKINRFDMSEYKDEVAINKFIGAPHGYVGFEEGGTLINAMKKNPNSVVLFDEIEKAHKLVFDLFLQLFDEGVVTSNMGKKISFKNNFIILTSNIGANKINSKMNDQQIQKTIKNDVKNFFMNELNRPEILGRIGLENIICFNLINKKDDLYKILDIYFKSFIEGLKKKKIELKFDKYQIYDQILIDVDLTKGARDIRNEFEVFKKHFNKALYENNIEYSNVINKKVIQIEYDNIEVKIIE